MSVEFSRSDDAESVQASLESKEQIRLLRINTGDGAILQPGCYYCPTQEREMRLLAGSTRLKLLTVSHVKPLQLSESS